MFQERSQCVSYEPDVFYARLRRAQDMYNEAIAILGDMRPELESLMT